MGLVLAICLSICLVLCLVFSLAGCGNNGKKIESDKDLPGAVIGVQLGTTGDIFASDYEEEGSTIERYNKGADAVLALTQGKIDCVIIDNEPAKAFVEANEDLKILEEAFAVEEYAICVSKENKELTTSINAALADLKADGTIDKIIKNYIGDDTKGTCPYVSPADVDTSKGELHMATNAFFEPYEFYDGEKVVGIDAMIAQAICDKLGYKLVIDDMDFDSIITAVKEKKADFGMAGMTVTDERLEEIDFTDTYTTATQVIIVKE
ncbi:MAG: transporter substrate-binding domain-containing protein [Clostridia bacterium]|nr:transporter substrate-binding domain-containing protein [Clostridia bacterium]